MWRERVKRHKLFFFLTWFIHIWCQPGTTTIKFSLLFGSSFPFNLHPHPVSFSTNSSCTHDDFSDRQEVYTFMAHSTYFYIYMHIKLHHNDLNFFFSSLIPLRLILSSSFCSNTHTLHFSNCVTLNLKIN